MRCLATCAVLLALCASCSTNRRPTVAGSVEWLRDEALKKAKQDGKPLFVLFTSPDNEWSERFDKYHADPDVQQTLKGRLTLLRIDTRDTPGGDYLFRVHGGSDTLPAFSILDPQGITLADSGSGAENIGFPVKPHEVEAYFAALKMACPKLTEEELAVLRRKLDELRPSEEQ